MKQPVGIVQSVHQEAIREINALESRIAESEDDADGKLWEQAEKVVAQLAAGLTQRKLADQWINARTGKHYDQKHVCFVRATWKKFEEFTPQDRPRFRDAYNEIANAKPAHVSHNSGENEWYTPPEYIESARQVMGVIDCDPASSPIANKIVGAVTFYTKDDDGLTQPMWGEHVWMNPPYSRPLVEQFSEQIVRRFSEGQVKQACVLVNNATDTEWFQRMLLVASAVCFTQGRVKFIDTAGEATGSPLQGQAILYLGENIEAFKGAFREHGVVLYG